MLLRAKQQGELPANDHSRLRGGQRRQADAAPCGAVHPRGRAQYRAAGAAHRKSAGHPARNQRRHARIDGGGCDHRHRQNGAVAGYRVGGKTGTSQKLDSENERARIASFVAVAPIENPKLAVLICLDEPHSWTTSGGALSGPVAAEVLQKSLPRLGIQPSYTEAEQAKYFTTVPDVTGWKDPAAAQKLSEYTLTADVLGQGERVVSQYPRAGTTVRRGSAIQLDTTGQLDPAADEG